MYSTYDAALFDLFGTLVDARGEARTGVGDILERAAGARWAIVTSCPRTLARSLLQRAGLPEPAVLVSTEDVAAPKPAPDGYLHAARLLKVATQRCIVFEDSSAGIAAGRAAGMRVIGVGDGWKNVRLAVIDGEFRFG